MGISQCEDIRIMAETQEELAIKVRELQKEVERLNAQLKEKRFGLTWIDVPEAFEQESENKIPVLEEVPELAIHNDDGKPTHILIEGDNYHALTCLNYTHRGKIDVIYIDPPYNTGKDGFTYKDSRFLSEYPDGTPLPSNHPLRHSSWLSFMEKRLLLAKELLSETGIMFISIGDDEYANLKLLCDKVFGENNFIETYIWNSISRPDNSSPIYRRNAEFVLCCCKNINKIKAFTGVPSETFGMPSLTKSKETVKTITFPKNTVKTTLTDGTYYAGLKDNGKNPQWELMSDVRVKSGVIIDELILQGHSYWATDKKIKSELESGTEIWIKSEAFVPYYRKNKVAENRPTKILPTEYVKEGIYANTELNSNIFHSNVFSNPKPTALISFLVNFVYKKDAVILDFFAGSGTTLHAIMNNNENDVDGKRLCILVQAPETTYIYKNGEKVAKKGSENTFKAGFGKISELTYERNKRVMIGFDDAKGNKVPGLGNSLKYYRTAFVGKNQPKAATDDDKLLLAKKAGCLLGLAENTLYETEATDFYQFYTDEKGSWTCIYFQENYSRFEEFRKKVVALEGGKKNVYVFCWTDGAEFATEFEYNREVTVKSIPQPILDIYKSLNA